MASTSDPSLPPDTTPPRRGRPPAGARDAREAAILDAALQELIEYGYEGVTMLGVARRASASKQTLYAWFGDRDGLFAALIARNADASATQVSSALESAADPGEVLRHYARGLLTLLTGPASVALNRAAMTSAPLAARLLHEGRHRIGPLVERYLADLADAGVLDVDDPEAAFELLYGLVVQDTQIRVLLGEDPPDAADVAARADRAVARFLRLTAANPGR
ncbi:MAG: TetR/AcrR family transcriptional regulator [Actinobacteria bacterium]|nr:TetR/AcrR family transcriptional regulator [Actinomycetota bacterium]